MSTFQNILAYIDTHSENEAELNTAINMAKHAGARLKIVDIVPNFSWPMHLLLGGFERTIELVTGDKAGRLEALGDRVREQGVEVSAKLLDGRLSVALVREVVRDQHDLVLKRAKGHRSRRSGFFGTTATKLFRKCPCAVLATGPDAAWPFRRTVAAVDATTDDQAHDELNSQIITTARAFSSAAKGQLDVISAWSVHAEMILKNHMSGDEIEELRNKARADSELRLDKLVAKSGAQLPGDRVHSLHGFPEDALYEFVAQNHSDLLVMGTVGRAGVSGLLIGNTAERILDRVQCSILAIKPDSFTSPIKVD